MPPELEIRSFVPELFPHLAEFAQPLGLESLRHTEFLNHYYTGQPYSRLWMALEEGRCLAILGTDQLRFEVAGDIRPVTYATNFYSTRRGLGSRLWEAGMAGQTAVAVLGGSKDFHHFLRHRRCQYFGGVHLYRMNARYRTYSGDSGWRRGIKAVLRWRSRRPLRDYASRSFLRRYADITVEPRSGYSEDLLPRAGFGLRWAPDAAYLSWRFNLRLPHLRYRLFAIRRAGQAAGYCILNDGPDGMIVAHADGTDPEQLAAGVLKSIFAAGEEGEPTRPALLASSHPAMQAVYAQNGFWKSDADYRCGIVDMAGPQSWGDPRQWLVSFGMGDNDLRPPMFWSLRGRNRAGGG